MNRPKHGWAGKYFSFSGGPPEMATLICAGDRVHLPDCGQTAHTRLYGFPVLRDPSVPENEIRIIYGMTGVSSP